MGSDLTSLVKVRYLEGRMKGEWKGSRGTVDMDWLDSNPLQRSDEVRGRGGSSNDGSHLSRQLPHLGGIDETGLASN